MKKEDNRVRKISEHEPMLDLVINISRVALFFAVIFFVNYLISESVSYILLTFISFAVFAVLLVPIIAKQKVRIEDDWITFSYRLRPAVTFHISDLRRVMWENNGEVKSFIFENEEKRARLSPIGYTNRDQLLAYFKSHIRIKRVKKKPVPPRRRGGRVRRVNRIAARRN